MHIIRIRYAYLPVFLMMRVCYLAHFHGKRIGGVVACARSASGKMEIPNLESEPVYLPHEIYQRQLLSFRLPFWFAGGEINTFLPDWEKNSKGFVCIENIRYMVGCAPFMSHVVGGTFEGSMTKDF